MRKLCISLPTNVVHRNALSSQKCLVGVVKYSSYTEQYMLIDINKVEVITDKMSYQLI